MQADPQLLGKYMGAAELARYRAFHLGSDVQRHHF
jgi:hypothetical protein